MKTNKKLGILAASLLVVGGFALTLTSPAVATDKSKIQIKDERNCSKPIPGQVACLSVKRTLSMGSVRAAVRPLAFVQPMGGVAYGANQLRYAYSITETGARFKVIAVVSAYHSESAYQDIKDYRAMYNLGPMDHCTDPKTPGMVGTVLAQVPSGKNPCFMQVDQKGAAVGFHETDDPGWAQETALDIEMATAICPHCSILLVEAKNASLDNLNLAVGAASRFKNVKSISNSYGGVDTPEFKYPAYASATAKGIAVVASSGDSGYGVLAPASFASVIAIGGTTLKVDQRGRWASESAWSKAGSGCSDYNRAAAWQPIFMTGCANKMTADFAAVADPATGVAVAFEGGWFTFGGTSVSAPIIAGMYAIGPTTGGAPAAFTVANKNQLHDIVEGSNGRCTVLYWCNAREGWDGPTGLGSPNGAGGF